MEAGRFSGGLGSAVLGAGLEDFRDNFRFYEY